MLGCKTRPAGLSPPTICPFELCGHCQPRRGPQGPSRATATPPPLINRPPKCMEARGLRVRNASCPREQTGQGAQGGLWGKATADSCRTVPLETTVQVLALHAPPKWHKSQNTRPAWKVLRNFFTRSSPKREGSLNETHPWPLHNHSQMWREREAHPDSSPSLPDRRAAAGEGAGPPDHPPCPSPLLWPPGITHRQWVPGFQGRLPRRADPNASFTRPHGTGQQRRHRQPPPGAT